MKKKRDNAQHLFSLPKTMHWMLLGQVHKACVIGFCVIWEVYMCGDTQFLRISMQPRSIIFATMIQCPKQDVGPNEKRIAPRFNSGQRATVPWGVLLPMGATSCGVLGTSFFCFGRMFVSFSRHTVRRAVFFCCFVLIIAPNCAARRFRLLFLNRVGCFINIYTCYHDSGMHLCISRKLC